MYNLYIFLGFIIGSILGSFLKAIADRSLSKKTFLGRSNCPKCHKLLQWYDLIPLISYIQLRGRCRYCKTKIALEYLLIEAFMGFTIGALFWQSFTIFPGLSDQYKLIIFIFDILFKTFIITVLSAITLTDLKETLIPDRIIIPSSIIALIALVLVTLYKIWYLYYVLSINVIGKLLLPSHSDYFYRHAIITAEPLTGGIIMAIVLGLFFFTLILVTRGRGMGGGDFKLGIFMGLVLGFPNAILALLLSFLTGSIVGVILLMMRMRKLGQTIPFGPFLSLGSIIAVFWGDKILDWYLKLRI